MTACTGVSVNDGFFHASIPTLEFGGVGDSGSGSYRGKASFDCFTHRRAITTTPNWMEKLLDVRYPPYAGKMASLKKMTDLAPDFDRQGKLTRPSFVWLALFLGGRTMTSGLGRWAVLLLTLIGLRKFGLNA